MKNFKLTKVCLLILLFVSVFYLPGMYSPEFNVWAYHTSSLIPAATDAVLSEDNKTLSFVIPDECAENDGYSYLLFWTNAQDEFIEEEPFYSEAVSRNGTVSVEIEDIKQSPSASTGIAVVICQHDRIISENYVIVSFEREFVELVIPEEAKNFNSATTDTKKGEKVFNVLKVISVIVIGAIAVICVVCGVLAKKKKKTVKAKENDFTA